MNALEVKKILINAGVDKLYHVNTVVTSLSFIKSGGLLSRQTAENMYLPQTVQETDETDKAFEIYNDIFFDSVDIHERAGRPNDYGTVMFVYNTDVLESLEDYDICITKDNPIRWNTNMEYSDKYFTEIKDLELYFCKGNFFQHITIKDISVPLSFDYLEKIVIDDPGEKYTELLEQAVTEIENEFYKIGKNVYIEIRKCPATCQCIDKYSNYKPGYAYHRFKTSI